MLKVKNLSKKYNGQTVLDDISLNFEKGKFITLLGKNGSGKSTLMRLISGEELSNEGVVFYKDEDLSSMNFSKTGEIGFVHEKLDYISQDTIGDFIARISSLFVNWDQGYFEYLCKIRKISLDNGFDMYSRGQKMQIALMINMSMGASLLLLDEITSVIDVHGRKFFLDELKKFVEKGNTVIMTTNIINELEFYTDQLVIIKDEKIQLNLDVSELVHDFVKVRKIEGSTDPFFDSKDLIWSGVNSDRSISYIIPKQKLDGDVDESLRDRRGVTLEDIFVYYFSDEEVQS